MFRSWAAPADLPSAVAWVRIRWPFSCVGSVFRPPPPLEAGCSLTVPWRTSCPQGRGFESHGLQTIRAQCFGQLWRQKVGRERFVVLGFRMPTPSRGHMVQWYHLRLSCGKHCAQPPVCPLVGRSVVFGEGLCLNASCQQGRGFDSHGCRHGGGSTFPPALNARCSLTGS